MQDLPEYIPGVSYSETTSRVHRMGLTAGGGHVFHETVSLDGASLSKRGRHGQEEDGPQPQPGNASQARPWGSSFPI